jgi:hypothetical protein
VQWSCGQHTRTKDIYELLSGKSLELSKLEIEVEALRIAAVLSDDSEFGSDTAPASTRWTAPTRPVQVPKAANADPQPEHAAEWKERTAGFP